MPCACRTSTLTFFIRRVAHVDLELPIWHSISSHSFLVAKRKINTLRQQNLNCENSSRNRLATSPLSSSSSETLLDRKKLSVANNEPGKQKGWGRTDALNGRTSCRNWLIHEARDNSIFSTKDVEPKVLLPRPGGRGAGDDVSNQSSHNASLSNDHKDIGEASFFEISPETIDALAADLLRKVPCSKSRVEKPGHGNFQKVQRPTLPHLDLQDSAPGSVPKYKEAAISNSQMPGTTAQKPDHAMQEPVLWQIQKAALKEKFKDGWSPRKRLSPDALAGIRAIHAQFPQQYTTSVLAEKFEVSPEAIRRILKGKWVPKEGEEVDRQRRWFARGEKVWGRYAELGLKPPARWRKSGVGKRESSVLGRQRISQVKTNVTVRSTRDAVRLPHEEDRAATLAERIL